MDTALLNIKDLQIWYKTYRGDAKVIDKINFYINKGEKVALVGESGCGKTTTMKSILRILDERNSIIPSGEILYKGKDILKMAYNDLKNIRRKEISMISQSPSAALNPVYTVGEQIIDIIKYSDQFKKLSKKGMKELALETIKDVMIPDQERIYNTYPHQLSGGMKQRICIAMSLVVPKSLLIADEPGTALDVTIQKQIHKLLEQLVEEKKMSLIMITHSLAVAREMTERIYVMYAGNIVETCNTVELFNNPLHPYTQGLMKCVPRLTGGGIFEGIYGYVPDYINPVPGCRFSPRCNDAMEICSRKRPPILAIDKEHQVSCFKYS